MTTIMSRLSRGWLSALVACLLPLAALGQAGSAGIGTGQVSNSATKAYLEGATVELVGTGRSTTTDRTGRFVFEGVPAVMADFKG